jgi:hypothetical protein
MSIYKPQGSPFYHYDFQWRGHRFHGSTKATSKREAQKVEAAEREKSKQHVAKTEAARTSLRPGGGMTTRLLRPHEVAERLGCTVKTLFGHIRDGSLRYVNVGRGDIRPRYMFAESDLAEFEEVRRRRNAGAMASSSRALTRIGTTP